MTFSSQAEKVSGQFTDKSGMKRLAARLLSWECIPISANASSLEAGAASKNLDESSHAWRVDHVGKTWMGLPMPGGLDYVGLTFAATCLGHHAYGTGSCSPGPMIRVPRRLSNISALIALDYKLLYFFL